jgi:hypothetical protein
MDTADEFYNMLPKAGVWLARITALSRKKHKK